MTPEEIKTEIERCKADPYHFYLNYWHVDGENQKMSREEFGNRIIHITSSRGGISGFVRRQILSKSNDKCDGCGKIIKGEKHPMYDENYNLQPGLYHCGCDFTPRKQQS